MDPEGLERPADDGDVRPSATARRPSVQQLLLLLFLFVALFAASFGASTFLGGGSNAESSEEAALIASEHGFETDAPDGVGASDAQGSVPDDADSPRVEAVADPIDDGPLLAIVIDDWGYGWEAAGDFLALDVPLNIAVIPFLPRSTEQADLAAQHGHQVILHLPMEPLDASWDLGDGAVTTVMADHEIAGEVRRAYGSIPYVSGINNHMGSRATADERVVRAVLAVVKEQDAFFLDSRTTTASVIDRIAAEMGVPYLENDRFVDPDSDAGRIRDRILLAADTALRRGWAVAIGHVHRATYEGLVAALPVIEERGVRLAYLRQILDRANERDNREQ